MPGDNMHSRLMCSKYVFPIFPHLFRKKKLLLICLNELVRGGHIKRRLLYRLNPIPDNSDIQTPGVKIERGTFQDEFTTSEGFQSDHTLLWAKNKKSCSTIRVLSN